MTARRNFWEMHMPACSPRVGCGDLRNWANLMHNGVKFWKTFKFYALWNAIMDDRYKYFVFRYICSWKKEFRSHFNSLLKSWDQDRTFNKMQYTACLVLAAYFQQANHTACISFWIPKRQAISTDTSFEVRMMMKIYAIEIILKSHEPFQSYMLTGQADSAKKAG